MAKEEKNADAGEDDGGGKISKKLLIMIIIGAVALVILSGLSVFLIMSGDDKPAEEQTSEEQAPQDVDKDGNPLPALYYPIKPPFLVTLPPGSNYKLLQVSIEVMTRQPTVLQFLKDNDPMVKHHLNNLLAAQNDQELKSRAGKEKLQAEVLAKIDELAAGMGVTGKVAKIYFTRMIME